MLIKTKKVIISAILGIGLFMSCTPHSLSNNEEVLNKSPYQGVKVMESAYVRNKGLASSQEEILRNAILELTEIQKKI